MKILSKTLGVVLVANAILCLGGIFTRGIHWHFGLLPVLQIGLPVLLLTAGVLQFMKPQFALIALVILFPLASFVVHFSMLPTWPLLKLLPIHSVSPMLIVQNTLVVILSLAVWLSIRKEIHNQKLEGISGNARVS